MEELIDTIRTATAADATDELRAAGARACRTLLTALEAKAGDPMTATPATSEPPSAAAEPTPVAVPSSSAPPTTGAQTSQATALALASVLRGMTPDQLMDLVITRLRAALPPGTEVPAVQPIKFPLVPINR